MSDQQLTFERDGEIVVLTMNNPRRKNALTPEMIALMSQAWDEIDADDCIRVAILTGYGDSYCVGGDLADGWMVEARAPRRESLPVRWQCIPGDPGAAETAWNHHHRRPTLNPQPDQAAHRCRQRTVSGRWV